MKSNYIILPCPHCGGCARIESSVSKHGKEYFFVRCIVCGASGKTTRVGLNHTTDKHDAIRDAVFAWNLRTPLRDREDANQEPETVDQNESSDQLETFVFSGPGVETV